MTESRLNRVIAVMAYAPIGAALYVLDAAPKYVETFVARGRAEVEARQEQLDRHVTTARSTGQVALAFGVPKLRTRARRLLDRAVATATHPFVADSPAPAAPVPPSAANVVARDAPERASWVPVGNGTAAGNGASEAPARSELPIPGYDALSASQVVERLAGLPPADLDAVRSYEASHRNRRTILGKIEQLSTPGS
jgi:hypothetical protein